METEATIIIFIALLNFRCMTLYSAQTWGIQMDSKTERRRNNRFIEERPKDEACANALCQEYSFYNFGTERTRVRMNRKTAGPRLSKPPRMVSCRQEPSEAAAQGQDSVSHIVPEAWPDELSLDAHPHGAIAMQHVAMCFLTATRRPTTVAACNGLFRRHKASGIS